MFSIYILFKSPSCFFSGRMQGTCQKCFVANHMTEEKYPKLLIRQFYLLYNRFNYPKCLFHLNLKLLNPIWFVTIDCKQFKIQLQILGILSFSPITEKCTVSIWINLDYFNQFRLIKQAALVFTDLPLTALGCLAPQLGKTPYEQICCFR